MKKWFQASWNLLTWKNKRFEIWASPMRGTTQDVVVFAFVLNAYKKIHALRNAESFQVEKFHHTRIEPAL